MANLFNTIPETFFSPLAGRNKEIYATALEVLFESLQNDTLTIKKNDYLRTLKEKASNILLSFDYYDEQEEDDVPSKEEINASNIVNNANYICKRLEETGWIDVEMDPDSFEEYIALPDYSISFLTLIHEIVNIKESAYSSLVHSSYSELKLEDEERDEFMYATLFRVFENTKKLKTELVTLGHSIRIYQHKLSKMFTTNNVLHDYFDNYKERISDRLYHPLKTFDSVAKFKRPIIAILTKWLKSDEIRNNLVSQSIMWGKNKDKVEAEKDLIDKINYICDSFESFSSMVGEIDQKHSDYTKSSASKILYLNNSDKTIKGHLETIFKHYAKNVEGSGANLRFILSSMQDSISLYEQCNITPDSLTLPILRRYREESDPLRIVNFDDANDVVMQNFLDEARNNFTDARIYEFMSTAFGNEDELKIEDIPLPDFDAFILIILATLKKDDESCFYTVDVDTKERIISQGYSLPKFTFKRKVME